VVENREYLIQKASYHMREQGYSTDEEMSFLCETRFVMLPSTVQYRPRRQTPLPRTHGPQTAKVVGKPGEQIWTDRYGCVKVQFRWDRYGKVNENSSCWVRVSSPWAGGGFGGIQLPRVNDEVIVDFIGGHPDRPIIIGRVYNASNMPPWDLPGNATQSGFLSRSKDGDRSAANALMFEDRAGQERIWLHAERDLQTEVEANELHTVEGSRTTMILGDDTLTVAGNRSSTTQGHESETFLAGADRSVIGAVNETIQGDETRSVTGNVIETITGNVDETIIGNLTQTTTGEVTRTITGPVVDTTTGTVDETITGDLTQTTTGAVTRTITGDVTDTITGAITNTVTGDTTSNLNGKVTETITGAYEINASESMTVTTPSYTLNNTGPTSFWQASYAKGTPARFSVVGASADAWGVRGQVYGVNFQWAAVKLDYYDFKNDNGATRITQSIMEAYTSAAMLNMGGPHMIGRNVNVFF
jgi:type VI secretion system secreted protein VgrG